MYVQIYYYDSACPGTGNTREQLVKKPHHNDANNTIKGYHNAFSTCPLCVRRLFEVKLSTWYGMCCSGSQWSCSANTENAQCQLLHFFRPAKLHHTNGEAALPLLHRKLSRAYRIIVIHEYTHHFCLNDSEAPKVSQVHFYKMKATLAELSENRCQDASCESFQTWVGSDFYLSHWRARPKWCKSEKLGSAAYKEVVISKFPRHALPIWGVRDWCVFAPSPSCFLEHLTSYSLTS